jgi:hypothetical protein
MYSQEVSLMTSVSERDVYEIAYLCGGSERVALTAVAALARDGRIRISRTRHRVQVVHRRSGHPVERAVLDAVPDSGKVLGPLLADVGRSAAVTELIEGLRRGGLVGRHSLAGHPYLSAEGRQARKELENSGAEARGDLRVAVLGSAGVADGALRDIFQSPDPPPGGKLVPRTRKRGYGDVPSDPPIPMHPGIPGRW